MSAEAASAAFLRLVEALNHARDPALTRAALGDAVHIDRHAGGARDAPGAVVESFTSLAAVERWVALTPRAVIFTLAGAAWPEPDGRWAIEYALSAGEFRNGGIWRATFAADGRIATLQHQPFALRDPG